MKTETTNTYTFDIRNTDNTILVRADFMGQIETQEMFFQELERRIAWGNLMGKVNYPALANAVALAQRISPEGGQVIADEVIITYGNAVKEILPSYFYDDYAYIEGDAMGCYEMQLEDGYIDEGTTFEDFLSSFEPVEDYFDHVKEGFTEFLTYYMDGKSFLYQMPNDRFAFVSVDDEDSVNEFISDLNAWTTKGYRYNSDFRFDSESVLSKIDSNKTADTDRYFQLLYKMALLDNQNSGYNETSRYGSYSYNASIMGDFFYYSKNKFFRVYFEEYGYEEVLEEGFEDKFSQEEKDFAYMVAWDMLEDYNDRYSELDEFYAKRYNDEHYAA